MKIQEINIIIGIPHNTTFPLVRVVIHSNLPPGWRGALSDQD